MKKFIKSLLLLIIPLLANAQSPKYWIAFKDKNNSPYSFVKPSDFLSARALARRSAQSIPLCDRDLPVNPAYVSAVSLTGAKIINRSKWLNGVTVEADSAQLSAIMALPCVFQSKKIFRKAGQSNIHKFNAEKSLPYAGNQHAARTTGYDYGMAYNQIAMLKGTSLHDNGYHGEGMVIALLDAGFVNADVMPAFDSLRANGQILGTRDFVDGGSSVYQNNTHGSFVLSTIGANVPGSIIGTAPKAGFYLLRTEDGFSENIIEEYNWVCGAEFADSAGADIISSSLGYTKFDDSAADHTYSDMDGNTCPSSRGADFAVAAGMVVLVSAGNEGNNSSWMHISAPSDADSVLSIAAVNYMGSRASFSSVGPSSDHDVKPDVAAQGELATVADLNGGIKWINGTSFSCPITAGLAACLWQAHPNRRAVEIMNSIRMSASQYGNPDSLLGYGIPDFSKANTVLTDISELSKGQITASVWPNPAFQSCVVSVQSPETGEVNLVITDMLGRTLMTKSFTAVSGQSNLIRLSIGDWSQGIYALSVHGKSTMKRLLIMKAE